MSGPTIHILLTRSGTCFSRLIHLITRDSYTHASIGLDGPDGPFYSISPCLPAWWRSGSPHTARQCPAACMS